ncbi:MAG: hypothetical protein ACI9F9_001584 [Candidatus Paceibacteria bacterium]|jgi:hypothetical protein
MLRRLRQNVLTPVRLLCVSGLLASSASGHITLLNPTGGEVLTVGETAPIEWVITIQHPQLNWDLEYSVTGPMGPWLEIVTDLPTGDGTSGANHVYNWVVPDSVASTVRVRVIMDNVGTDYIGMSTSDLSIVPCVSPVVYCATSMNSVGAGATIGWLGSPNVSTNSFALTASGAPANKPGLFYYGPNQIATPFGEGVRCVGGSLTRLAVLLTDGAGQAAQSVDVNSAPSNSGPGIIVAGGTYNFQLWYRDPLGGVNGFNLTDGLMVTYCP